MTARGVRRRRVVVVLAAAVLLAGCAPAADDVVPGPAMEVALADHEAMLRDVVGALREIPGGPTWEENTGLPLPRTPCPDVAGAESAELATLYSVDAYEAAAAERAAEVVADVAAAHGFEVTSTVVEPENVVVRAEDAAGARLTFSSMLSSVLTLTTACHAWDEAPAVDHVRPPLLDGPDAD